MTKKQPSIIFACVGNSSRSQMAEAFARKYFPPGTPIVSAGTKPAAKIDPTTVAAMAEIGIDISGQKPKLLTTKMLAGATHFISMGCGVLDSCPFPLAKGLIVEDWGFEDTKGKDIDFIRKVRDEIERRVKAFAKSL
ncbi:MAG: arsenate reductase ArsC [Candidatus Sigynarchaeota archaeon]